MMALLFIAKQEVSFNKSYNIPSDGSRSPPEELIMSMLIKHKPFKGRAEIVKPGLDGLKLISFDLLSLEKGMSHTEDTGTREVCAVILGGQCDLAAAGREWKNAGSRPDVFSGPAASLFIPAGNTFSVSATGGSTAEVALLRCEGGASGDPLFIPPERVKQNDRGKGNWLRRVHDIVDRDIPASRMLVGETHSPAGNWSSAPPHCHDIDNPPFESNHEEIYFFKCHPSQGFQLIRLYTDDRSLDIAHVVENNDTVVIDRGYHPVAAGPGYKGYYLWILAGESREILMRDDPCHKWLKEC